MEGGGVCSCFWSGVEDEVGLELAEVDDVAVLEANAFDFTAVDARAVVGVEVGYFITFVIGKLDDFCVKHGDVIVVNDDGVVRVAAQGGDIGPVEDPSQLPQARVVMPVMAEQKGYVHRVNARGVGLAVVTLGGGRQRKDQAVEHCVGCTVEQKVGAYVEEDTVLGSVHALTIPAAREAAKQIRAAYLIGDKPVKPLPIIYERVTAS